MEKQMKAKTYVTLTAAAFLAALALLALCVAAAERAWGIPTDWKKGWLNAGERDSLRNGKARYIRQTDLPYDAFIFGGSKAGALQPETLARLIPFRFYNYFTNGGTFVDYELYQTYLYRLYGDGVQATIIHLSSHEVTRLESSYDTIPPAVLLADGKTARYWASSIHYSARRCAQHLNIESIHAAYRTRKRGLLHTNSDGSQDFARLREIQASDADGYVTEHVLDFWGAYGDCLHDFFHTESEGLISCESNIASLRRMQEACAAHGTKLIVVIGPTFISELHLYASPLYPQYLTDLVRTAGEVWNFSGINDVNLNPYNFADGGHYFDFVGDAMLETIFGGGEANVTDFSEFGILLTPGNVGGYIEFQRERWRELKAEYDATGAVTLRTLDDASYLGR